MRIVKKKTYHIPKESSAHYNTKTDMMNHLYSLLGGHIAEKLFLGPTKVTTGCSNDLERATEVAYAMVRQFGMEESYGVVCSTKDQTSDEENKKIDDAVQNLLKESSKKVEEILKMHETQVRDVAQKLFEYEYLTGEEVQKIIEGKPLNRAPVLKKDSKI